MSVYRAVVTTTLAMLVIFGGAVAEDLPDLAIEKYELSNGLDVILHEDHSIPVVAVNVWYHVGSKNESPGRTGFAHLFEHLMFEGSEHNSGSFTDGITKYGGTRNGSTNTDRTNYWENMPSHHLERMIWMEADRMGHLLPVVTQERLDVQRDVVKNEKRQNIDDQPYGMVDEVSRRLMYPSEHPYSWTTIGLMEDLSAASLEDVHAFNRKYYSPNNASLCIAGDFDPEQAKAWVEKYFGALPPGPPVDRLEAWVPTLEHEIRASMKDEVRLPRLYMAWHTPPYYAPGDAEFDLLASVLAGGKSSRLYKELVYDKQIAQDVTAYQASREIGSTFHIFVTAKPGHTLEEMETEVDRLLNEVLTDGITAEEFERAKVNWESGFIRQLENIGGFGGRADQLNSYNVFLGDPDKLKWDQQRYTSPTAAGVVEYAREYLKPDARLVLHVEPLGQLSEQATGVDWSVEPTPMAEKSFPPPSIQHATLSNGMELYLVEDHELPLVQVNLQLASGWAADPTDRPGASSLTAELLNEGTKTRNALDIANEAQRLGIQFGTGSGFDNSNISLNATSEKLDAGLALMADVVINPTFPQEELDRQKQIYLGNIQQEASQPFTVAFKSFFRELYGPDHPYGQPYTGSGTEESISAITRADIVDFYKNHYVPNNSSVIVVGDLTLAEAKTKVEKAFKGWKQAAVAARPVAKVEPTGGVKICIIDQPGTSQSAIVMGNLVGPRNVEDFVDLQVVNQGLGGGSSARLYKNLREDKAYTYGAYCLATTRVGQGAFVAYAQVQTDVTEEALAEFVKEIRGLTSTNPLEGEELADSRNALTKSFPQGFQTVGGIAGSLGTAISYGLPMDEWQTFVDRVNSVDVDRALAAARKYIKPNDLLIVVVGDREQIEPGIRALGLGEVYYAGVE